MRGCENPYGDPDWFRFSAIVRIPGVLNGSGVKQFLATREDGTTMRMVVDLNQLTRRDRRQAILLEEGRRSQGV